MFVEVICSNALLNAFAQSSEWFKALIHLQYMRSTGETTATWLLSLSWCFFLGCRMGSGATTLCHLILLKRLETMLKAQEKIMVEHRQTAPPKKKNLRQTIAKKKIL